MASLEQDTLADVIATTVEARTEEKTTEGKEAGAAVVVEEGLNDGDGNGVLAGRTLTPVSGPPSSGQASSPANTLNASGSSAAAHPKKFSAVNINKKFLEKTGSSAPSAPPTTHAITKLGSFAPKPTVQTNTSHSRLVTTKLTAGPPGASTAGPGWSRPSSTAPQHPNPTTESSPIGPPVTTTVTAAPQLPVAGKVIQPQLRVATPNAPSHAPSQDGAHGSARPVWRTQKIVSPVADPKVQSDFPTAAEVAQVRTTHALEQKEGAAVDSAKKQVLKQQADAFRGVHLDPNAHHWDEMEGDDDDFLDGVIEFGDGKQYKIEPADAKPSVASEDLASASKLQGPEMRSGAEPSVSKDNRFADDFDRSWPRSTTTPTLPHQRDLPPHTATGQYSQSSRTLFNERSNRLEHVPPGFVSHREGPAQPSTRRDSRSHPTERRFSGDSSAHGPPQGVQLLQKPPHLSEVPFRSRGVRPGLPHEGEVKHDGSLLTSPRMPLSAGSQASFSGKDTLPPSMTRTPSAIGRNRDVEPDFRPRRLSNMGPPPLPSSSTVDRSKDTERQLPPHLSPLPPPLHRAPSRGSVRRDSAISDEPHPALPPSSPRTLSTQSPITDAKALASNPEYEEASKVAMHTAAERARLRRQQEEEEREKEKERARKKAAELEAKFNLPSSLLETVDGESRTTLVSDAEILGVIADAVKTVSHPEPDQATDALSVKSSLQRPPSMRGVTRPPSLKALPKPTLSTDAPATTRKSTFSATSPGINGHSPAQEAFSWRSKSQAQPQGHASLPSSPAISSSFPPKAPPMAATVEQIMMQPDEVLEIVDFSDMGKFVGADQATPAEDVSPPPSSHGALLKDKQPSRPVASDFFGDDLNSQQPTLTTPKTESASWRRKGPEVLAHAGKPYDEPTGQADTHPAEPQKLHSIHATASAAHAPQQINHRDLQSTSVLSYGHELPPRPSTLGHASPMQLSPQPSHHGVPRSPRTTAFREAPMSALDDAMSRIKGALDGMQVHETIAHPPPRAPPRELLGSPEPSRQPLLPPPAKEVVPSKWLPPALRSRSSTAPPASGEPFEVTQTEPPRSPKSAWNTFTVRIPQHSSVLEIVSKKQVRLLKTIPDYVRWDILSWNPPVEGMSRRDLSVNDVLFKNPPLVKGKSKYTVVLPSLTPPVEPPSKGPTGHAGLIVSLPQAQENVKAVPAGAFGRLREADGTNTWRKPTAKVETPAEPPQASGGAILNTVSRSPPPPPPSGEGNPSLTTVPAVSSDSSVGGRPPMIADRRIPDDAGVAFYRDPSSRPTSDAVSFTVVSELEDKMSPSNTALQVVPSAKVEGAHKQSPAMHPSTSLPVVLVANASTSQSDPSGSIEEANVIISHGAADIPQLHPTKASVVRGPDPEHLKAVWSQASDKADLPASNSLEGIADDLTALQRFTLQDVKSDRGTPPLPTPAGPSRMSLSEVTRAFQQVPTPSSNIPESMPPPSPSSTSANHPIRRPSYGFPNAAPNSAMRPPYPSYPTPMMTSPSPTLVYPQMAPSPGSRPMQLSGPPQQYGQPMWIPVPPGSAPPTPAGMVRTLSSPYMTPVMAYSPSGPPPNMYPPPHSGFMHAHPQQAGPQQGQMRGMPMLSPMTPHAAIPMYAGSPVLMHAQPYPSPMTPGRAPPRPLFEGGPPPGVVTPRSGPAPPLPYGHVPFQRAPW